MLSHHLSRGKSILLLGPRQVGKTTLLASLPVDLRLNLIERPLRLAYERRPERLLEEVRTLPRQTKPPLIVIDEVQKVPDLLDVAQQLIDGNEAQLILTGSSARKLRRHREVNLLPGRLVHLRLDPLCLSEMPARPLEELIFDGSLPAIVLTPDPSDRMRARLCRLQVANSSPAESADYRRPLAGSAEIGCWFKIAWAARDAAEEQDKKMRPRPSQASPHSYSTRPSRCYSL